MYIVGMDEHGELILEPGFAQPFRLVLIDVASQISNEGFRSSFIDEGQTCSAEKSG